MNETGIDPCGNRVLVRPEVIDRMTEGGIAIPESIAEQHQGAQAVGYLAAKGPDAWRHLTKKRARLIDGGLKVVEVETTGYSKDWAEVGDRVAFAKYGGQPVVGEDGLNYRIMNDEDITAIVSEEVSFTDIQSRKRVGLA